MNTYWYTVDAAATNGHPPFRHCADDVPTAAAAKKLARVEYERRNGPGTAKGVAFYATRDAN